MLSTFITIPNSVIDECPCLKNYLSKLVQYHANNIKIKKEIHRAIAYLSKKLNNSNANKAK